MLTFLFLKSLEISDYRLRMRDVLCKSRSLSLILYLLTKQGNSILVFILVILQFKIFMSTKVRHFRVFSRSEIRVPEYDSLFCVTFLKVSIEIVLDLSLDNNRIWIGVFLVITFLILLLNKTTLPKS
jgi:hypothetical protein